MLTIANKGMNVVNKCQKHVYIICEGSLMEKVWKKFCMKVNMFKGFVVIFLNKVVVR